jgi:hypothetical protein
VVLPTVVQSTLPKAPSMQTFTDVPLHAADVPPAGAVHSVAFGMHSAAPLAFSAHFLFAAAQS